MVDFGNKQHCMRTGEKLIAANHEVTEDNFCPESLASSSASHALQGL